MSIARTAEKWHDFCGSRISAGYSPGGDRAATYESGLILAKQLRDFGAWQPGDMIIDVGSGNGRLAMGLLREDVHYIGLEIIGPCVDFCREAFGDVAHMLFVHLDVRNERYWPQGKMAPEAVTYPLDDSIADAVIANSLFSHTATLAVAEHNLAEMRRILKPGGRLYTTWFFGEPVEDAAKTVYCRADIEALWADWLEITREGFAASSQQVALLGVKRG